MQVSFSLPTAAMHDADTAEGTSCEDLVIPRMRLKGLDCMLRKGVVVRLVKTGILKNHQISMRNVNENRALWQNFV